MAETKTPVNRRGVLQGIEDDRRFFMTHQRRKARIRFPNSGEYEAEFLTLGPHNHDRRRILVFRSRNNMIVPVPFLLHADETVEDTDEILLPILKEMMERARDEQRKMH